MAVLRFQELKKWDFFFKNNEKKIRNQRFSYTLRILRFITRRESGENMTWKKHTQSAVNTIL